MTDRRRSEILDGHAERIAARAELRRTYREAKTELHPRRLFERAVDRSLDKVDDLAAHAARGARKAAPVVGAVGLGALLIVARQPIWRVAKGGGAALSKLRTRFSHQKDDHE